MFFALVGLDYFTQVFPRCGCLLELNYVPIKISKFSLTQMPEFAMLVFIFLASDLSETQ